MRCVLESGFLNRFRALIRLDLAGLFVRFFELMVFVYRSKSVGVDFGAFKKHLAPLSLQFLKYAGVGLFVNVFAYGAYLLITWQGGGHKWTMTVVFVFAVTVSYLANKKFTFRHDGDYRKTYSKFWIVYGGCYAFNFSVMYMSVDMFGFKHQLVQLGLIVFDAPVIFLLQKLVVFRETKTLGQKMRQLVGARPVALSAGKKIKPN
jgi:putative flippase GtrA